VLAAFYFANKALLPVKAMTRQAEQISAINMDLRLPVSASKDELNQLAHTFNSMMGRLQQSFESQRQVVNQISHEIRTPLAAIIAELDLALSRERGSEEYKAAITWARQDAGRLQQLTQSLLDLAKASYDPSRIAFKPLRLDEVLIEARKQLLQTKPEYQVQLEIKLKPKLEKWLHLQGNAYLLQVAFKNLLDNACKFSPKQAASLELKVNKDGLFVQIEDEGLGIPEADIPMLGEAFFRGQNRGLAEGHGIGLHLTAKIFKLHGFQWEFQTTPRGTTVKVQCHTSNDFLM
jgi:signal transduction histidine kinase